MDFRPADDPNPTAAESEIVLDAGRLARVVGLNPADVQFVAYLTLRYGPQAYSVLRRFYLYTGHDRLWRIAGYVGSFGLGCLVTWWVVR